MGPIALLLQQLHYYCFALDPSSMCLLNPHRREFAFLDCPFQLLKPTLVGLGIRARNAYAVQHRSVLKDVESIDGSVFELALRKLEDKHHRNMV
eukprot:4276911-Karenia_brevis.AAC.1